MTYPQKKGKYQVVLSSDDEEFGGKNRIDKKYVYQTRSIVKNKVGGEYLTIYIPARTAMVLRIEG